MWLQMGRMLGPRQESWRQPLKSEPEPAAARSITAIDKKRLFGLFEAYRPGSQARVSLPASTAR